MFLVKCMEIPTSSNLIITSENKFLLLKRSKVGSAEFGKWCFVGGGIEDGETIKQALERETLEEIGCKIKWLKPFMEFKGKFKDVPVCAHYFYGEIDGEVCLSEEHSEFEWFSFEDIDKLDIAFNQKEILMEFIGRSELK
jgi:8-oxo-dGTP pyrophosphatase MutT (NUDIX family)